MCGRRGHGGRICTRRREIKGGIEKNEGREECEKARVGARATKEKEGGTLAAIDEVLVELATDVANECDFFGFEAEIWCGVESLRGFEGA